MTNPSTHAYAARMARVVAYIEQHLGSDLSVERLSEVSGISKFHFHRLFTAFAGVTVAQLVRELRLKQAAYQLAFQTRTKVIDVALQAGYSNPETFSRAFKTLYDQTPSAFRRSPRWRALTPVHSSSVTQGEPMNPQIRTTPAIHVAVLEHRGPPESILSTVGRFIEWRKQSVASPVREARTFGIPYEDLDDADPNKFRFEVCGELIRPLEDNAFGVVEKVIPAGRVAVERHFGSTDRLRDVVLELYRTWLPQSGEQLRDFPCYFEYVRRMPDVPEHEQVTDIYLPIQ